MPDLHEMLAREASHHASPPPPFAVVLARVRRRRAWRAAGATFSVAAAVTAAIAIPNAVVPHESRVALNAGPSGTATPSANPTGTLGSPATSGERTACAGLTIDAVYGGQEAQFARGKAADTIVLSAGESLSLTATGPCANGVVYTPDGTHIVTAAGQIPPPVFNDVASPSPATVRFTASDPGVGSISVTVANNRAPFATATPTLKIRAVVQASGQAG